MKNVYISGASRGIGSSFVDHYLSQGCRVWAGYRTQEDQLDAIKNSRLHLVKWDVRQEPTKETMSSLPDSFDILINNAGVYGPKKEEGQSLANVTPEVMHEVFDVNCVGALRVVQRLWQRVARARGVIANVSSKMGSSSDNTSGGCYAYRTSKAALVILSKSMAVDLATYGVKVITLHPGWVRTEMTDNSGLIDPQQSVAGMARVIEHVDGYEPGAFVAFDGKLIPY